MKIKELRKQKGYKQKKVAKDLNLATTTYFNYENELREPDIKNLINIANYFNVTLDYLCERKTNINEIDNIIFNVITKLNNDNKMLAYAYCKGLFDSQVKK